MTSLRCWPENSRSRQCTATARMSNATGVTAATPNQPLRLARLLKTGRAAPPLAFTTTAMPGSLPPGPVVLPAHHFLKTHHHPSVLEDLLHFAVDVAVVLALEELRQFLCIHDLDSRLLDVSGDRGVGRKMRPLEADLVDDCLRFR